MDLNVLPGEFQDDRIEGEFGIRRQQSGGGGGGGVIKKLVV